MTVLLKNLFTVHFQFDLLKLETNNTCDDKQKHAWIIARWTVVLKRYLFDHCGDELGWISFNSTPEHAIWTGPPNLPNPNPNPNHPPQPPYLLYHHLPINGDTVRTALAGQPSIADVDMCLRHSMLSCTKWESTEYGARTHDHTIKSRALFQLS